ncbi:unnamed protein product [Linum trigynum]|uniref:Uncharacterized protein n=1 Tax=Linum trigynum TaxID=586398 RepID=A0AAV2D6Y9_9ROSI
MMVTARWVTRHRFYGYSVRAHGYAMRRRWVFTRVSTGVVSTGAARALDFGVTRALCLGVSILGARASKRVASTCAHDSGATRALCLGVSILGVSSVW